MSANCAEDANRLESALGKKRVGAVLDDDDVVAGIHVDVLAPAPNGGELAFGPRGHPPLVLISNAQATVRVVEFQVVLVGPDGFLGPLRWCDLLAVPVALVEVEAAEFSEVPGGDIEISKGEGVAVVVGLTTGGQWPHPLTRRRDHQRNIRSLRQRSFQLLAC
ncbi:MAG: hypothetical protein P8J55_14010 [Pseudomonadales bacterium]|nr:hypothetical protein [Pseudomonadales bacterium]